MYPEYAEINGKEYKIDTDFNVALQCFEILEDESISDEERALAIIYLLFNFIPDDNLELFLEKAILFLQCGKNDEQQKENKKDMDFIQDKKYIYASFMSDYSIDLTQKKLHFWYFIDLIEGLTENCSLNRIRDLRNYDLSEIKDPKFKQKIRKAQKEVALKRTKKRNFNELEKENIANFYKIANIERR